MITPYNILRHELTGLTAVVVDAKAEEMVGLSGEIVAESKNTITVKTKDGGRKILPKDSVKLKIELPKKAVVEVDGRLFSGRPQERTKKKIRITFKK